MLGENGVRPPKIDVRGHIGGQKAMTKETRRTVRFYIRCTDAELAMYKAEALEEGLGLSDYFRTAMTFYRGVKYGMRTPESNDNA